MTATATATICYFCRFFRANQPDYLSKEGKPYPNCGRCAPWDQKRKEDMIWWKDRGHTSDPFAHVPTKRTDAGFVYFVQDQVGGEIKIGCAQSPRSRLDELKAGNPHPLDLITWIPGGFTKEKELHRRFAKDRVHGEWFRNSVELIEYINSLQGGSL